MSFEHAKAFNLDTCRWVARHVEKGVTNTRRSTIFEQFMDKQFSLLVESFLSVGLCETWWTQSEAASDEDEYNPGEMSGLVNMSARFVGALASAWVAYQYKSAAKTKI